jgi:hypothetical protein
MPELIYGQMPDEGEPTMVCINDGCVEYATPYSARRGDYFSAFPEDVVRCSACGQGMWLVRRRIVIEVEDDDVALLEDWQYEVANGDTRLGYDEWRQHRIEVERR